MGYPTGVLCSRKSVVSSTLWVVVGSTGWGKSRCDFWKYFQHPQDKPDVKEPKGPKKPWARAWHANRPLKRWTKFTWLWLLPIAIANATDEYNPHGGYFGYSIDEWEKAFDERPVSVTFGRRRSSRITPVSTWQSLNLKIWKWLCRLHHTSYYMHQKLDLYF